MKINQDISSQLFIPKSSGSEINMKIVFRAVKIKFCLRIQF